MNKRLLLLLIPCMLLLAASCQSYTAAQGKEKIGSAEQPQQPVLETKYSVIEAEKQAVLDAQAQAVREAEEQNALEQQKQEEAAHLLEQQQREQQQQQALSEAEQSITALKAEKQQLSDSILSLQTQLAATEDQLKQSKQTGSTTDENLAQTQANLSQLQETYDQLEYRSNELENLLAEQQALAADLKASLAQTQQEQEQAVEQLKAEQQQAIGQKDDLIENLQSEVAILKAQLEEKTQTLEEKNKLEQQREEEAKKLEEQRQAQAQQKALEAQKAAEAERQKQSALEQLYKQIPPLSQLTLPRTYTTDEESILAQDNDQLKAMLLPLDDTPWTNPAMAEEVQKSISDLKYPLVLLTGHMQNVIDVVRKMGRNATLVEGGAIISSYAVLETDANGIRIQFSEKKTLRISLADLPEYRVLAAFNAKGDWASVQKEITKDRTQVLASIIKQGPIIEPTLLGASLYEPSHQDWNSFSPIPYRQVDYLWPLCAYLEDQQFYDVYRTTHFSSSTDAGNTFLMKDLKERIDYLFSRKLLPLSSSMLTIGGESVPDEAGISHYGIVASFLVP
jgi:hypothetical protein